GFIVTPLLIIALGLPPELAVGTSIAMILLTSTFGLWKRRGTGTVDGKLAAVVAAGTAPGVVVGIWLLHRLKNMRTLAVFGRPLGSPEYVMLWLFLALLLAIAALLLWDYRRSGGVPPARRVGLLAKTMIGPRIRFESLEHRRHPLIPLVLLAVPIGILTGLLGVGGGVLLLPSLNYLVGQRAVKAAGTSLLIVWLSTILAFAIHLSQQHIVFPLAAILTLLGIFGAHYGTELSFKLNGPRLRLYFVAIVLVAAALVGAKIIHITL
ncbi:MAG TPA: sulfite exporter TauE/SafE family protein, partial [Sedimentisphaerales bacterium]|nr:sulfite exporter TauE/SafE family protein [Sedimentisphaerales bacterium]